MISGSEVAFFSLSQKQLIEIAENQERWSSRALDLLQNPRNLLATILVANNLINIALVLVSDFLLQKTLGITVCRQAAQSLQEWLPSVVSDADAWARGFNFLVTVILVTFLLVLFGEVAPKIYSNTHSVKMTKYMSGTLTILSRVLYPITRVMERGSWVLERSMLQTAIMPGKQMAELDKAIELTTDQADVKSMRQQDILKGLLAFNEVTIKEVMKSRMDMVAVDLATTYDELLSVVRDSGYSRIPVYREELDQIAGILYVKDLISKLDRGPSYAWQSQLHTDVLYAPESKKISDLLVDFQESRRHMAIVVDEYGGTAGLITLEDVIEEVVGEIKDEFDLHQEVEFEKINDEKYVFEGKTLLKDVCRVVEMDEEHFEPYRGDSDSIAGLYLEVNGRLPRKFQEMNFGTFTLKAISVSRRRIEKVMITLK